MTRCVVLMSWGLCAAILAGCGKKKDTKSAGRVLEPRTVTVACAQVRPMVRTVVVTGTLAAQEISTLSAKVSGRLQQLTVDLGSTVTEGTLVAQIEPLDYQLQVQQAAAALAQARAALGLAPDADDANIEVEQVSAVREAKSVLDQAVKNLDRVRSLSKAGIASQSELEGVESAHNVAASRYDTALADARARTATMAQRKVELEVARKRLDDASVKAPFTGAVQSRPAHLGEYVSAGTPIIQLVKGDPLRLQLQVPERECTMVRLGQVVQLFVDGDTNTYTGKISRLSPALDQQSRMLLVEADVPAQGSLRPGLFTRASIIVSEDEQGVSVPGDALATFAGIEKVLLVQNGKALERVVSTGRRGPDWVEIVSGIATNEEVILKPGGLITGQPVNLASAAKTVPSARQSKAPTAK